MDSKSSSRRWNLFNRQPKPRNVSKPGRKDGASHDGTQTSLPKARSGGSTECPPDVAPQSPPAATSQAITSAAGSQGSQPAADSAGQQASLVSPSQRLWNEASDGLEKDDDTAKLVRAYVKILATVLADETDPSADSSRDAATEPNDPAERQDYMKKLIEKGQAKVVSADKATKGLGDVAKFVLSAKAMVDLAIQNIPQAALPWAGVCVALQVLLNPANAARSHREGIVYVVSRMEWYCSLTEHLLKSENIAVGKENFQSVYQQLEAKVVAR